MTEENQWQDWSGLWLQQSKIFFETTEQFLEPFFKNQTINPQTHSAQIEAWLLSLKKQLHDGFKHSEMQYDYLKIMQEIFVEAAQLLEQTWKQKVANDTPIKTSNELYLLWLDCCQIVYEKKLATTNFQNMFADMMQTAMTTWQKSFVK